MSGLLATLESLPEAERWPTTRRAMLDDPLPVFRELLGHRPVLRLGDLVLVTRHADCLEVLRRHDLFSVQPYHDKQGGYWMAQDDTAEHWREKSIMHAILDLEDIPLIRRFVADRAAGLLAQAGGAFDAVDGLTRAVPIALVQEWFGFDQSDPEGLRRWSYWNQMDAFWNQPFDPVVDPAAIVAEREAANAAMRPYLIGLVQRRGAALRAGGGGTDPVSRLLRFSASAAVRFPVERVVLNVGGLLIGAVETTSHAAVNALDVLLSDPQTLAAARTAARDADLTRLDGFVFEALRFRPAFPYYFRTVTGPAVLARNTAHEHRLGAGDMVLAITHAAMFDPAAFSEPERFDPGRGMTNSFHFGHGIHECLGRAIGGAMVPEIVRQALLLSGLETGSIDRKGGPVPEAWAWRWER